MNKARREKLEEAISLLSKAEEIVEKVRDDEQDSMYNIPENLQCSSRYESMEDAVDSLTEAVSNIEAASDSIEGAMY